MTVIPDRIEVILDGVFMGLRPTQGDENRGTDLDRAEEGGNPAFMRGKEHSALRDSLGP